MNASVGFSKRDLRMENIRDVARRVREANRRTVAALPQALAGLEDALVHPVRLDERDLERDED